MRSSVKIVVLGAFFALVAAAPASAQFAWLGGGGTFPMGDYGGYANTGYMVTGGVGMPVGAPGLNITAEAFFGQNGHEGGGSFTNPYGLMAELEYDFVPGATGVYVFGGAGVLVHRYHSDEGGGYSSSSKGLGLVAGAGYSFPLGVINGWVEGRLHNASIDGESTRFGGLMAGIGIPLGSS
jgi:hypothetical protein